MERIAIYGKGGVGKSVVATNLSVCSAMAGHKVLHIGCDPKHDSAVRLLDPAVELKTVLEILGEDQRRVNGRDLLNLGRLGIACCECGGPDPGVGCAGRGVARTLEVFEEIDLFRSGGYDLVMFDVLGDVVCGGFAAPLRAGFARKVFIVTSEEPMSLYAANNISKAVRTYAENGVVLGGLVGNLRLPDAKRDALDVFAALLGTRVVAVLQRDESIIEAERVRRTLVEFAPEAPGAQIFQALSREVLELDPETVGLPNPLTDAEFFDYLASQQRVDGPAGR